MDPLPLLRLPLRDGSPVGLRPLVPSDAGQLLAGFAALSSRSRRLRFLSPLSHLTPEQVRYLTEIDQETHIAWGAVDLSEAERPGVGVARMVRLPEASGVAEFSLTVLDPMQGKGLGSLMLALLVALARLRGIEVLRGYVARDNTRMTAWLTRLGARTEQDDLDLVFDLPVDPEHRPPEADGFARDVERIHRALLDWEHAPDGDR
ncbi:MAG: GNAT family N-acetyltransferase [Bacteroidota bacterium]